MTKEITIGDKLITFTANGATALYYKQFFKKDLLTEISTDGREMEIASESIPELGFIMAKQADKADMMHLKYDNYLEWLEVFEPLDLALKGAEIFNVYVSNSLPSVDPKKKAGKAKG